MRQGILSAALALSIMVPAATEAKEQIAFVTDDAVKDKPQVALDPARAHILVRANATLTLYLMKMPAAQDQLAYDGLRAEALAKARAKYAKRREVYENAKAIAAKQPKGAAASVPVEPVEPTESNFEFTPFGLLAAVSIGPVNRFAKEEGGGSTYLHAVTPGTYRIYGPLWVIPGTGSFGSCFCMGSVRFEAKAGEIVDLGTIITENAGTASRDTDLIKSMPAGLRIDPAGAGITIDPRLKAMTIHPADYHPVGKLPNYFGVTIGRLPEIPGVMRYERDRIVDLTGQR